MKDFIFDHGKIFILYFLVVNVIAFILFGIDKSKARRHKWRIPELTLMMSAVLGGGIGGLLGMKTFHHKTKKPKFFIGVPFILIVWIVCFVLIMIYL